MLDQPELWLRIEKEIEKMAHASVDSHCVKQTDNIAHTVYAPCMVFAVDQSVFEYTKNMILYDTKYLDV